MISGHFRELPEIRWKGGGKRGGISPKFPDFPGKVFAIYCFNDSEVGRMEAEKELYAFDLAPMPFHNF